MPVGDRKAFLHEEAFCNEVRIFATVCGQLPRWCALFSVHIKGRSPTPGLRASCRPLRQVSPLPPTTSPIFSQSYLPKKNHVLPPCYIRT